MVTDDVSGPRRADLIRRLRAWSVASWRHGDRIALARAACQRLADLAADREGAPRRAVPDHGESALADQLAVLLTDALAAGVAEDEVDGLLRTLASGLAVPQR